jgi:hypothetical protein
MALRMHRWGCGHLNRHYDTTRWCPACSAERRRRWRHWMALGLAVAVALLVIAAAVRDR